MSEIVQIEWRKVVALADGSLNCEINHPLHGWIPFTASHHDVELHGRQIWAAISEGRKPQGAEHA